MCDNKNVSGVKDTVLSICGALEDRMVDLFLKRNKKKVRTEKKYIFLEPSFVEDVLCAFENFIVLEKFSNNTRGVCFKIYDVLCNVPTHKILVPVGLSVRVDFDAVWVLNAFLIDVGMRNGRFSKSDVDANELRGFRDSVTQKLLKKIEDGGVVAEICLSPDF